MISRRARPCHPGSPRRQTSRFPPPGNAGLPMRVIGPGASPTMNAFSVSRARVVMVCLLVAFTALSGRVVYLQTYGRQTTIDQAERQQYRVQVSPSRRGSVYDRNGMEMAGTVQTTSLFV